MPGELFAPPNPLGRYCITGKSSKILEYIINRKASALRFFMSSAPPQQVHAPSWGAPTTGVLPRPGCSRARSRSRARSCSRARGQSARETHAPGHITLWLRKPHCGRCPLEVDTYCDIGVFCCRWCWYRDTYSGRWRRLA